jgi:FecR protein
LPSQAARREGALASSFRIVALLLVAIGYCGCWEGTSRETLATVLWLEGSVSVSSDHGRSFAELRATKNPGKGEILRTSSGARLWLALLPNSLVELDPETSVEIVRIGLTKDGNETGNDIRQRFSEINLRGGRIFVSHFWGEARARLAVSTGNGEVSTPSNAAFWVEFAEGKTRLTCVDGWVEFRPAEASSGTRILPGSIGQWPSGDGNIIAAATDSRGQDDLQQGLELEQKLRDLTSRKRNELPR